MVIFVGVVHTIYMERKRLKLEIYLKLEKEKKKEVKQWNDMLIRRGLKKYTKEYWVLK